MKLKHRTGAVVVAASVLAIAVPAVAHPGPSTHSSGKSQSSTHTHRCAPHKRAYIVSGAITDGSGMTQNSDGTWSSSTPLTYTVTHHNRWAKDDGGSAMLTNVKVVFDGGATDFSTGNHVKLIGKVEYVRSRGHNACSNPGPQGDPAFRMLVVSPAAS